MLKLTEFAQLLADTVVTRTLLDPERTDGSKQAVVKYRESNELGIELRPDNGRYQVWVTMTVDGAGELHSASP